MTNLNITKDDEYESDYDYLDDTENYEENNLTKLELKKRMKINNMSERIREPVPGKHRKC